MKSMFTFLFSCLLFVSNAKSTNPAYAKLCDVNKCWTEQKDIATLNYPTNTNYTERKWIAIHLQLVEQTLRSRSTTHLTEAQKKNRLAALDHLNTYWKSGAFPINEDFSYRLPIFIDKHDNFCAVGYLVKATGYESVSRMIASKTNYAYVREMNYPELGIWAKEYGFTVDELAWVQPGYPPARYAASIGNGTDGEVVELYVDKSGQKMYVGGAFTNVDGTIVANNIAYVTEAAGAYTWHKMGSGVNGKVNAIIEFRNKLFVAGKFTSAGGAGVTNVAYWDGANWISGAGCLWGEVKQFIEYNGDLYACGSFDVCAALADINFAKWDSTYKTWTQLPGLSGQVNTMQVVNGDLVLGGNFKYNNKNTNIIKADGKGGFTNFSNTIEHEVMDIEEFNGNVYAACKKVASNKDLLKKLVGSSWQTQTIFSSTSMHPILSYNTLCIENDTLMMGGDFTYTPMLGTFIKNNIDVTPYVTSSSTGTDYSFIVDSTINKMVVFKGSVIAGGKFKYGYSKLQVLNGIARKSYNNPVNVSTVTLDESSFDIYPNPTTNNIVTIENDIHATTFVLTDVSGKTVKSIKLKR